MQAIKSLVIDVIKTQPQKSRKAFFQTILQNQLSFACWRLPQTEDRNWIIDTRSEPLNVKLDLEESPAGFAVSPFLNKELKQTWFIKAEIQGRFTEEGIEFDDNSSKNSPNAEKFWLDFQQKIHHSLDNDFKEFLKKSPDFITRDKSFHLNLVEGGIESIQKHLFQKVVLSRCKSVDYPAEFEPLEIFQKLCEAYPTAFCYFFHIPQVGTWMGASPETLISTDKNRIFRTVALAGTQLHQPKQKTSEALWSQKEIEEQALVSRYIINCFKKLRLREFEEEGPKTVIAGNLLHLKTSFWVDMEATNFPQLGSVMLELLHPTSAVCGMPKDAALDYILAHEGYNREFYSGFLGPVNIDGESHIFVNLRCMQLTASEVLLYAGGGITEDSIPEKEWQETEIKCNTMLKILT
jgi:isochorismate synthase